MVCNPCPSGSFTVTSISFNKILAGGLTRTELSALKCLSIPYFVILHLGHTQCDMSQVDVVEDESTGKRTIKTTTICWGNKLSLLVSTPLYDPRLPANPNDPDLDFSQAQIELNTEADWQKVPS